jgi:hypothetical protein
MMNVQNIISICGVEGTGKTSLVQALRAKGYPTLTSPQIHESGNFSQADVSRALEEVNLLADEEGDLVSKTCALFLAMSLQPKATEELSRKISSGFSDDPEVKSRNQYLYRERDPILDFVVQSPLYPRFLKPIHAFVPKVHHDLIESYFTSQKEVFGESPLRDLPKCLLTFFAQPTRVWMPKLIKAWNIQMPSQVMVLTGDKLLLENRLALKPLNETLKRERKAASLLQIQHAYLIAAEELSKTYHFDWKAVEVLEDEPDDAFLARISL